MGIISSKPKAEASLLAPSMEGNLDEVKRLVGIAIANNPSTTSSTSTNDNNDENDGPANANNANAAANTNPAVSAYVNAVDPTGNAAIHGATFAGHLPVLQFLVETCGADLRLTNGLGCSPLWIAAGYDRLDCLEYLVEKLARSDGELEGALVEDANSTGDTPFLAAASRGNLEACRKLVEAVEKCGNNDNDSNDNDRRKKITKARLIRTANDAGDTALKVAVASSQSVEMIEFLLQIDEAADISEKESEGETLDRRGKCVNRKNNSGLSPLIVAAERNLPQVAELLLKHGADISITDDKGRNPLAIASFCGCNDTVEFLLQQQPQQSSSKEESNNSLLLNERDAKGCTPLWLAARTGNVSIVELLMDAGADDAIADTEDGLLPKDVAGKFKKEKVMEYFANREEGGDSK